jgi:hypothetical protein
VSAASPTISPSQPRAALAILWGGLIAGTLDINAAFLTYYPRGISPVRILKGIAAGLLGPQARQGGWKMAALGLALHFIIAYGATITYFIASRKLHFLTQRPFIWGPIYGITVFLFMNMVVLPLSALHSHGATSTDLIVIGLFVHMLCIGLPIALTVRYFSK